MKRARVLAAAAVGPWLAASVAVARAQSPAPPPTPAPLSSTLTGAARADYESARTLLAERDFEGALARFTRLYRQVPDPRLLANIALCEKDLSHCARSTALFDEALSTGAGLLSPAQKSAIHDLVRACAPRLARIHLAGAPAGAAIEVDGALAGIDPATSEVVVDGGTHRVRVARAGYRDLVTSVTVAAGGRAEVAAALEKAVSEGGLAIRAGAEDTVTVDARVVGKGSWEGRVAPGVHSVAVSADGMKPYRTDVRVIADQTRTLDVTLEAQKGPPTWLWATSGALVFAGVLVAVLSVFRPAAAAPAPASPVPAGPALDATRR